MNNFPTGWCILEILAGDTSDILQVTCKLPCCHDTWHAWCMVGDAVIGCVAWPRLIPAYHTDATTFRENTNQANFFCQRLQASRCFSFKLYPFTGVRIASVLVKYGINIVRKGRFSSFDFHQITQKHAGVWMELSWPQLRWNANSSLLRWNS